MNAELDQASPLLRLLRERPTWGPAIAQLRARMTSDGEYRAKAAAYGSVYEHARAAMVFDVVASQRRRYTQTVLPAVARFKDMYPGITLKGFLVDGPRSGFGLPAERWATILEVIGGLDRYRDTLDDGLDITDDQLVLRFAHATQPVRHAPTLDPFVGSAKGIGVALFAYLRMRSGVDGLKPDVRVLNAFKTHGFAPPRSETGLLLLAEAIAEELGITCLELDQLLWRG